MSNKIEGIPLSQGPQPSLLCPTCGCDCSHIREVYTEMGTDPYEAGVYSGTEVKGRTGSRRSALAIVIDGECGHQWILRIQQHKGRFPKSGDDPRISVA